MNLLELWLSIVGITAVGIALVLISFGEIGPPWLKDYMRRFTRWTLTAPYPASFPPLVNCAVTRYGPAASCPGPGDLLVNAKQDLVNQLKTDAQCQSAAKTVYSKVTFGGLFDWFFTSPIKADQFLGYLQNVPTFFDGTRSTLDFHYAQCGGHTILCGKTGTNPPQTVKFQFAPPSTVTAITVTPSEPLQSFWQPTYTAPGPTDSGFGVGINPASLGVNIYNESNLFHEALHGFTGLDDQELQTSLGLPQSSDTTNISIYIKNNVLASCPTFR
jgi:hypothetical protein